jgi:hypothetical protein
MAVVLPNGALPLIQFNVQDTMVGGVSRTSESGASHQAVNVSHRLLERSLPMISPKMRVRAMMAFVAIIALGIWGEQMRRRRAYCLKKSLEHRSKLLMISSHFSHPLMSAADEEKLRRTYPHAAWHLEVSDAYLRCANRPWQPVPPEPDEPFSFPPGKVGVR